MKQAVAAKDWLAYGSATRVSTTPCFSIPAIIVDAVLLLIAGRIAALRTNLSSPIDVQTPASFDQRRELLDLFKRGKLEGFTKLMTLHISNSGHAYARALEVA